MREVRPARARIKVRSPGEFERWQRLIEQVRQRREKGATLSMIDYHVDYPTKTVASSILAQKAAGR